MKEKIIGLQKMLNKKKFYAKEFKWSDGGELKNLIKLQKKAKEKQDINILPKVNEEFLHL